MFLVPNVVSRVFSTFGDHIDRWADDSQARGKTKKVAALPLRRIEEEEYMDRVKERVNKHITRDSKLTDAELTVVDKWIADLSATK